MPDEVTREAIVRMLALIDGLDVDIPGSPVEFKALLESWLTQRARLEKLEAVAEAARPYAEPRTMFSPLGEALAALDQKGGVA